MTLTETTAILRQFNAWRRGDEDIPQFDPRKLGEVIDAAVEMIAAAGAERDELRAEIERQRRIAAGLRDIIANLRVDFQTAHARMMTSAATEREACAQVCENHPDGLHMLGGAFARCAAAIRARGES